MTVAWQPELQRACEAAEWLVVEARGDDGEGWGCLLLFRGDAWGVLLYERRWLDGLADRSPERLRRHALRLVRAPLDEAEARDLLAAAPERRPGSIEIAGEDPPDLLGELAVWPERDWLLVDAQRELVVWDLATGEPITRNPIGAICRDGSPHFRPVVDGATRSIAVADGVREFALWSLDTFELERVYRGHEQEVYGAAFVGADHLISGSGDSTLRRWDRRTGVCQRVLDVNPVRCIAARGDGRLFAAGGSSARAGQLWIVDGALDLVRTIRVPIAPATYAPLPESRARSIGIVADRRDSASIRAIAWHPDGRHVVTGGWDFVVKMFDVTTGAHVRSWTGHSFWVETVAISADGAYLASGSGDGHVRIWPIDAEECLADYVPGPKIEGVCFAGDRVYASTDDGRVIVLP